ncbi:hypothetical protein C8R42DRAFT_718865 [Lentinula raphanica]|nr:hypothetical protein C8R42DRAFT_718865 [Lentinula raphanica]
MLPTSNRRRSSVPLKSKSKKLKTSSRWKTLVLKPRSSSSEHESDIEEPVVKQEQNVEEDSDMSDTVKEAIRELTSKAGTSTIAGSALAWAVKQSSSSKLEYAHKQPSLSKLERAHQEANKGFRSDPQPRTKGKAKAKAAEPTERHEISFVAIYPYGIESTDSDNGDGVKPLSRLDASIGTIRNLCDMGLCIESTPASPLRLDPTWTVKEVDRQLVKWLPLPTSAKLTWCLGCLEIPPKTSAV